MPYTESHADTGTRVAGAWLAAASFLLAAVLAFHGPLAPTLGEQMRIIATSATRWAVVHWAAAVALSLFAVAALIVLSSRSRLTADAWTMSAWAVLPIGALWTITTAIAEVTVIADAAVSGSPERFRAWWAFAEAKGAGFTFMALAIAVIAGSQARTVHRITPIWASTLGAVAGVASFVGWAVGVWLGISVGNLLWVASSLLMCLWTLWFGIALARTGTAARPG